MNTIAEILAERGVSRLCHFTPSRNLPHILSDGYVRATKDLVDDVRAVYTRTDLSRLDGHQEKICCSIEFTNGYYFTIARTKGEAVLFPDWIVLLIDPIVMSRDGTLFCTGNAARGYGSTAYPGADGLTALYQPSVVGSGGTTFNRVSAHLPCCPTDLQAEVLVPGPISLDDVLAIAVKNVDQARAEVARLRQLSQSIDSLRWVVAPMLFERQALASAIQTGRRPTETAWTPEPARS